MATHQRTNNDRRIAYIEFNMDVDADHSQMKKKDARDNARKRFQRNRDQKLQIADALLDYNLAVAAANESALNVPGWDEDAGTAPIPTSNAEANAHDALVRAYVTVEARLNRFQTLQRRFGERDIAIQYHNPTLAWLAQTTDGLRAGVLQFRATNDDDDDDDEEGEEDDEGYDEEDYEDDDEIDEEETPEGTGQPPDNSEEDLSEPPSARPRKPGWVGSWPLGGGSFGGVQLFVRQNASGRIMKRVAVKDSSFKKNRSWLWDTTAWFWTTNHRGEDIPVEVSAMYNLRGRRSSRYIVEILGWRQSTELKLHRIYMEYCSGGNLSSLFDADKGRTDVIPEPFIWYCAEALATSGVSMLYGDFIPNPVTWTQIIHRDWKTDNVFLDAPQEGLYAGYPTPKLGDFGLATFSIDDNHSRATDGRIGTVGSRAPESMRRDMGPFTSKSDVWAVGGCLYSLMNRDDGLSSSEDKTLRENTFEPDLDGDETIKRHYSSELRKLVQDCMRFRPADRPSFPDLLRRIQRTVREQDEANDDRLDGGLRLLPADSPNWDDVNNYLEWNGDDKFQMYQDLRYQVAIHEANTGVRPGHGMTVPDPPDAGDYQDDDDEDIGGPAGAEMEEDEDDDDDGIGGTAGAQTEEDEVGDEDEDEDQGGDQDEE